MDNRKITIIMTYYDREFQLIESIKSIGRTKHDNYNIVIVDDCSPKDLDIEVLKKHIHKDSVLHIIKIDKQEKNWNNPVIVYNKGILKALELNSEIIILQNAESYHFGDVLSHANKNINDNNYFSYGCFSLNKELTFNGNFETNIKDLLLTYKNTPVADCENGWYNHPVYNPRGFDFCSAISVTNLKKLNGFDERYATCIWYGDDDFKLRVNRLGLPIHITQLTEEPIVIHQWHDHNYISSETEQQDKNRGWSIYTSVINNNNSDNNYIAIHTNTTNFN